MLIRVHGRLSTAGGLAPSDSPEIVVRGAFAEFLAAALQSGQIEFEEARVYQPLERRHHAVLLQHAGGFQQRPQHHDVADLGGAHLVGQLGERQCYHAQVAPHAGPPPATPPPSTSPPRPPKPATLIRRSSSRGGRAAAASTPAPFTRSRSRGTSSSAEIGRASCRERG